MGASTATPASGGPPRRGGVCCCAKFPQWAAWGPHPASAALLSVGDTLKPAALGRDRGLPQRVAQDVVGGHDGKAAAPATVRSAAGIAYHRPPVDDLLVEPEPYPHDLSHAEGRGVGRQKRSEPLRVRIEQVADGTLDKHAQSNGRQRDSEDPATIVVSNQVRHLTEVFITPPRSVKVAGSGAGSRTATRRRGASLLSDEAPRPQWTAPRPATQGATSAKPSASSRRPEYGEATAGIRTPKMRFQNREHRMEGTQPQELTSDPTNACTNACTNLAEIEHGGPAEAAPATAAGAVSASDADGAGERFAAALAMIATLPLADAEKAEAVRRLLADQTAKGKP